MKQTLALALAGLLLLGSAPRAAATSNEFAGKTIATYATQTLYAYTADNEVLGVKAVWPGNTQASKSDATSADPNPKPKQDVVGFAYVRVTDPTGKVVVDQQVAYDGTKATTIVKSNLVAADGQAGVWRIDLRTLDKAGAEIKRNVYSDIDSWLVNVRASAASEPIPGRVWTERLFLAQPGIAKFKENARSFPLWYVSDTGTVYQANYAGYNGRWSIISADDTGPTKAGECLPLYRSTEQTAAVTTGCGRHYKIFFENPMDAGLPASARAYNGQSEPIAPAWAAPDVQADFTPTPHSRVAAGTVTLSGFTQISRLTAWIDGDGNDSFDASIDRLIPIGDADQPGEEASVAPGMSVTFNFDGQLGDGSYLPASSPVRVLTRLQKAAEIHFTMTDVEMLSGGLKVKQLKGPNVGSYALSWDDSQLSQSGIEGKIPDLKGTNADSSTGQHGWNSEGIANNTWGDKRHIDNWTYAASDSVKPFSFNGNPAQPVLKVTKDDGKEAVSPDEELTYVVNVDEIGGELDEVNGTVVDYLPNELVFAAASDGGVYEPESHTVTWTGVQVPFGGSVTRTVTATVRTDIERGDFYAEAEKDRRHEFTNVVTGKSGDCDDESCQPPVPGGTACAESDLCDTDTDYVEALPYCPEDRTLPYPECPTPTPTPTPSETVEPDTGGGNPQQIVPPDDPIPFPGKPTPTASAKPEPKLAFTGFSGLWTVGLAGSLVLTGLGLVAKRKGD
ncbi:MAG: DUF11 domain-containing protein [Propionibacteriaceae bacterium]|jgi:hypothetical protein|nr:DUF11 domain-containing protein [Propionibacteriaceae bacterium]